jgi:hypothetical protein
MWIRHASYAVLPVLLVAGGFALRGVDHASETTIPASRASPSPQFAGGDLPPSDNADTLPPGHPPIGGMTTSGQSLPPATDDPPALAWTVPDTWRVAPNPNAMRVATYRVPGGVDVSVSRAGGETEANIKRWTDQFDDIGREGRVEKTVHGLHVVTADIAGTYVGGGTAMGGPAEAKRNWALVGAIVEGRSPSYFFKMTGPATAVRAARPTFDRVMDSISPL